MVEIDEETMKEVTQQLSMLYKSHEKNLEKLKYNVIYKKALTGEMKKIETLLEKLKSS